MQQQHQKLGVTPNLEEGIHVANERTETKHWYFFFCKSQNHVLLPFSSKLKIGQLKKRRKKARATGRTQETDSPHCPLPSLLQPMPPRVGSGGQALVWKWLHSLVMEESLSCPFCLWSSVGCVLGWICLKDWIATKLGCCFSQPAERRCC